MTETAREALLKRSKGGSDPAKKETARDLLARRANGETFALPKEHSSAAAASGYGRGGKAPSQETLNAMRDSTLSKVAQGAVDDPMGTIKAIPSGINRGVAQLAGLPVDTMANIVDLGGMAYGAARSELSGQPASEFYTPMDRSQQVGSGEFNANMLDTASESLGGSPVTQNMSPDNPAARLVYAGSAGIPGAVTGRMALGGATGGAASQVVAEAGGDPAMQAAAGLVGGHTPQSKLNAAASKQSMGAAGAAVDLEKLSPELRNAVEQAVQKTGGAVNEQALARQVQADSLPVKVALSEGQALGDPGLISNEMNMRGKQQAYRDGFAAQNTALVDNLRVLRDETGPDVFSTNPVEHADTLISRYKAIDDERRAEISAKYKALEDANGGQFPVNGSAFVAAADAALAKKMKGRYLPAQIRGDIEEFKDNAGFMSFEQFENLRTNLATEARTAERQGNGNAAAAINIVRRELENLPMDGELGNLKALANDARSAAKARFDALDADPAYKAAVNDSVTPDAFVQKFVVNGARDNVDLLSQAMAGDESALQTLKVATLDHLRKSAGVDGSYNGNFSQAGFNKALQALDPKILSLLDPKTVETVRNLGDVARYTQFQPKGSFVNNSNTFVAAAAEHGADVLEGVANVKAGGLPVGSWMRNAITDRQGAKRAAETFKPGAGLTKLNELLKGKDKP